MKSTAGGVVAVAGGVVAEDSFSEDEVRIAQNS